jgi:mannose-6-phosphate isomerase-like protein (cupin superfamily)
MILRQRLAKPIALFAIGSAINTFGTVLAQDAGQTKVVSAADARLDSGPWGNIRVYFAGATAGTRDLFSGVAEILPGQEIHPAHTHAEEEYLLITEGSGLWTVKDQNFPAKAGDMLYAAPWDLHGIKNTSNTVMKFVVLKWSPNGKLAPKNPLQKAKP